MSLDNLNPQQMVQAFGNITDEQAKKIANTALQIAAQKLQAYRTMAGTPAGTPLRTINRTQADLDQALQRVDAYQKLTGKIPEMDFLKQVGLQGTFGPVAGQDTFDAKLALTKLARSGGSGGGSKKDLTKAEAGDLLRMSLENQYNLFKQNQNDDPRGTGNKVSDNAAYWAMDWVFKNPEFKNTAAYYNVDVKNIIDDFITSKVPGKTPDQFFNKGGEGEQLKNYYDYKYKKKDSDETDQLSYLESLGIKLPQK